MATLDLIGLAAPIDPDQPSGENLEYDSDFLELERAAQGKPERQVGDTIVPAEEPDWRTVHDQAVALLHRTKDIRVATYLARALIRIAGPVGFSTALGLIRGLIEQQWPTLHPQLDADEDNDPEMRINALIALRDPEGILRPLREAPLVRAPRVGAFSLRDMLVARGEMTPAGNAEPVSQATIDAAFADAELEALQETGAALAAANADLAATEAAVLDSVGAHQAPDLAPLSELLREMERLFAQQAARRGGVPVSSDPLDQMSAQGVARSAAQSGGGPGEIRSRADVIRAIDQILGYYQNHEPSSAVPLLLRRAQRIVPMDFMAVMRELASDSLGQIQTISGVTDIDET